MVYIFHRSVFAIHFLLSERILPITSLNVGIYFHVLKKQHTISIIHHRNVSRDKIFLPVAKSCFYNRGTLPYQSQIVPAYEPEWVFSPGLYVKATSFSLTLH
jgi:hypothetical protein